MLSAWTLLACVADPGASEPIGLVGGQLVFDPAALVFPGARDPIEIQGVVYSPDRD